MRGLGVRSANVVRPKAARRLRPGIGVLARICSGCCPPWPPTEHPSDCPCDGDRGRATGGLSSTARPQSLEKGRANGCPVPLPAHVPAALGRLLVARLADRAGGRPLHGRPRRRPAHRVLLPHLPRQHQPVQPEPWHGTVESGARVHHRLQRPPRGHNRPLTPCPAGRELLGHLQRADRSERATDGSGPERQLRTSTEASTGSTSTRTGSRSCRDGWPTPSGPTRS